MLCCCTDVHVHVEASIAPQRVTGCVSAYQAFICVLETRLRSLCLYGKYLTDCALFSPDATLNFTKCCYFLPSYPVSPKNFDSVMWLLSENQHSTILNAIQPSYHSRYSSCFFFLSSHKLSFTHWNDPLSKIGNILTWIFLRVELCIPLSNHSWLILNAPAVSILIT